MATANGGDGVHHGAYTNAYVYDGVVTFGNRAADVSSLALPRRQHIQRPHAWREVWAAKLRIAEHKPDADRPVVFTALRTEHVTVYERPFSGRGSYELHTAPGWPLTRADFTIERKLSRIVVFNADGTSFVV